MLQLGSGIVIGHKAGLYRETEGAGIAVFFISAQSTGEKAIFA